METRQKTKPTPKNPQPRNKWRKFKNAGKRIIAAKKQLIAEIQDKTNNEYRG